MKSLSVGYRVRFIRIKMYYSRMIIGTKSSPDQLYPCLIREKKRVYEKPLHQNPPVPLQGDSQTGDLFISESVSPSLTLQDILFGSVSRGLLSEWIIYPPKVQ
jgi:hypothetical protein